MSAFPPKPHLSRSHASSSTSHLPHTARNNLNGLTAYQREKQFGQSYGSAGDVQKIRGKTEFDLLKENLRFIREGEDPKTVSWEEKIARAYESKLFKEYALIDLKHYKSQRLALRWRTAPEVINGIGESTCASLRCPYHLSLPLHLVEEGARMPGLKAFELPFGYEEGGVGKMALVKVRVCGRCESKLLYKPGRTEGRETSPVGKRRRSRSPQRREEEREDGRKVRIQSRSRSPDRLRDRRRDRP